MLAAVNRKPRVQTTRQIRMERRSSKRWRAAVRGFRLSSDQSTSRLKSMAAVRAKIMQSRTRSKHANVRSPLRCHQQGSQGKWERKDRVRKSDQAQEANERGLARRQILPSLKWNRLLLVIPLAVLPVGAMRRAGSAVPCAKKMRSNAVTRTGGATPHLLLVLTVFLRQERKTIRLEMNQCVPEMSVPPVSGKIRAISPARSAVNLMMEMPGISSV